MSDRVECEIFGLFGSLKMRRRDHPDQPVVTSLAVSPSFPTRLPQKVDSRFIIETDSPL